MSNLADHAKAFGHLADAFDDQAAATKANDQASLLSSFAAAYRNASNQIINDAVAEAREFSQAHACTLEHLKGKVCPACGKR